MKRTEHFASGTELYNESTGTMYRVIAKHSEGVYEVISTDEYDEEKGMVWENATSGYLTSSEVAKLLKCERAIFTEEIE